MNKYRIKTKILPEQNQYLKVNLEQDFDVLDILTLSIYGADVYPNPCGDWGVLIGRVVDSNSFPMENVKVGYIIPLDDADSNNITIKTVYDNIRNSDYPLLPNYSVNKNHYPVGGFPSEDEVMSNSVLEYVYKKYFKYVTSTNQNGDYVIIGVPIGYGDLLMNFDSTDAGSLSTTPIQQLATGQKDKKNFNVDKKVNNSPLGANKGKTVTGTTKGSVVQIGTINTSSTETGGKPIVITGASVSNFGGGVNLTNQNGDSISVVPKLTPNGGGGGGTLIGRGTKVFVKSFFGDADQCEIGINRYDYKLEYKYQPCNYIIGSFYADYNVFDSATPTYTVNNMSLATMKEKNMGGKVAFMLDSSSDNEPDVFADVASDGTFYAAIPCKWDRYNIDEEGNWYKTNDDFTKNPTGIFTRTPYCLMVYNNQNVSVNIDNNKTYARASAIGFNLNNSGDYVEQIGTDGSLGLKTITRFGIKYNAQYYFASPFPNGYYYPIDPKYYKFPEKNAGTKYRNGAELNWDYENRRSNIYTIATQWTKYGYYSALNIENNGLSGLSNGDIILKSRYSPMPNLYSTKSLIGNTELITTITTTGIVTANNSQNVLPLDDNGPYGWDPGDSPPHHQYKQNMDTGYYPNGNIGRTAAPNGGIDFVSDNKNPAVGSWVEGGTTNSYFKVNTGNPCFFKIKGSFTLKGWYDRHSTPIAYLDVYVNRDGNDVKIKEMVEYLDYLPAWADDSITFNIDINYYFNNNDIIYFRFRTEGIKSRMSFRLENTNIGFYKIPTGTVFPLIVGNMYLPTFEATKNGSAYYPVGAVTDILDVNEGGYNAPKLTEVDIMLYPITDELFNIVEHSQINNPYENGTINYYFFCNQFWKLRDLIYNEIN